MLQPLEPSERPAVDIQTVREQCTSVHEPEMWGFARIGAGRFRRGKVLSIIAISNAGKALRRQGGHGLGDGLRRFGRVRNDGIGGLERVLHDRQVASPAPPRSVQAPAVERPRVPQVIYHGDAGLLLQSPPQERQRERRHRDQHHVWPPARYLRPGRG